VAYLHPIAGGLILALLAYLGSLGLRSRGRRRGRMSLLARHARMAPAVYCLVLISWAGGALSSAGLRSDLAFAESLHFRIGTLLVVLLTGSALTARSMRNGNATARGLHPWLGAAAVLLAAAHAATGLRIMP
jgi:Protein of unknown function (DUF4079)